MRKAHTIRILSRHVCSMQRGAAPATGIGQKWLQTQRSLILINELRWHCIYSKRRIDIHLIMQLVGLSVPAAVAKQTTVITSSIHLRLDGCRYLTF